jgi:hypothetical protein
LETLGIQAERVIAGARILNADFLHREIAYVIGLVTAAFGRDVDQWLIEIGQEFEISSRHLVRYGMGSAGYLVYSG